MPRPIVKTALISVYDKTGLIEFARTLVEEFGVEIISTGGTAKHLKEVAVPVTLVEDVTGFPEMLDGRVKTLHPKIHAAILADRDNPEHMRQLAAQGIKPIDMVVVNLYPFEKTVADPNCTREQAIEMIDIGGPCLLRAAAKNQRHVIAVCNADEVVYERVVNYIRDYDRSVPGDDLHPVFAAEAFLQTSCYDERVHAWLQEELCYPKLRTLRLREMDDLRYGENPHQKAAALWWDSNNGIDAAVLYDVVENGTPERMSYNNLLDADAAIKLCIETQQELGRVRGDSGPASTVFVKHTNACGVGIGSEPTEAYRRAYLGDPNAAMGGILACSFQVTAEFAGLVMETYDRLGREAGAGGFFVEVWIAPAFAGEAIDLIRTRKPWGQRVRLRTYVESDKSVDATAVEYRSMGGGMLRQTRDLVGLNEDQWKVTTRRQPSDAELDDLRLAWLIAKHTKSNAISVCKDGMLLGNGAGQMSRVMSCRIATWLAKENGHGERLAGAVAASDAFFPFADGPNVLMDAGIKAIIQPGGSKRDEEVIAACDTREVAMIFTGTRHFRH
ncbi:MAG: bifunctional phosphoribosylaminoimidazolecarboxamide formyltransferase/IMP cyclohydrolase [Planctomycetota bacterium]